VARIDFLRKHFPGHILMLCALVPLMVSSCGGGHAAQHKSFTEGLNANIGVATIDDLISTNGPPQQSFETPEGTWYTWRKVNTGSVSVGAVSMGFLGMTMMAPAESGQELNCQFDRNTGKLRTWNYREW
jgi:hypothetical protein